MIIHQYDPELKVAGGVNTCLRDMLSYWAPSERILLLGVSSTRAIGRVHEMTTESRAAYSFLPLVRLNPGNRWPIPHTLVLAIALVALRLRHPSIYSRALLVQTHRSETTVVASFLSRAPVCQLVHTDLLSDAAQGSDSFWRYASGARRWLDAFAARRAVATVAFNEGSARWLRAAGGNRVSSSSTWHESSIFYPPSVAERSSAVLWIGRFEQPKNPLLALEVAATSPNRRFVFVGQGTLEDEMAETIARTKLTNVEVHPPMAPSEIADLMRSSACLLMTSRYEGSPRVLFEAIACGLPVVATEAADPARVLEAGAGALARADAQELATAISTIGPDQGRAALATSERFQASQVLDEVRARLAGNAV